MSDNLFFEKLFSELKNHILVPKIHWNYHTLNKTYIDIRNGQKFELLICVVEKVIIISDLIKRNYYRIGKRSSAFSKRWKVLSFFANSEKKVNLFQWNYIDGNTFLQETPFDISASLKKKFRRTWNFFCMPLIKSFTYVCDISTGNNV